MVTSGMSFAMGVQAWSEPYIFRKLRDQLLASFDQGGTLTDGLRRAQVLPVDHVQAIYHGEQYGTLDRVLPVLRELALKSDGLKSMLAKAMMKPSGYLMAGAYIIPGGKVIQGKLTAGAWLIQGSWSVALIAVAYVAIFNPWLVAPLAPVARVFAWLPGVRGAVESREMTRFANAMSLGLDAGAALPETFRNALTIVQMPSVKSRLVVAGRMMEQGQTVSYALGESQVFAGLDAASLVNAEQTGNLPAAFRHIAERQAEVYEGRINFVCRLVTMIIMGLVGLYIAYLIIAGFQETMGQMGRI